MIIGEEHGLNEDDLNFICDEIVGQDKWFYYPPTEIYLRLNKGEKIITSACYGRFLPDRDGFTPKSRATVSILNHWRSLDG